MMHYGDDIIIDYYIGAFGPTIRIETNSKKALYKIRDSITKLKDSRIHEYSLLNYEYMKVTGVNDIIMKRVAMNPPYHEVEIIENKDDKPIFLWYQTVESLDRIEGLIDGLIDSDSASHQYLTSERNNVLIELVYKE